MTESIALTSALRAARDLLVVTGAGVSAASGIPTFRGNDPGAIWKHDVLEMATLAFFQADPLASWRWYLTRFDSMQQARPNPAHQALAALERWQRGRDREFLLVTQNIDTLHEQAGSEQVIKVHGSSSRVRCPAPGCRLAAPRGSLPSPEPLLRNFLASPTLELLPRCPECDAILRPHVLWFDEYYQDHEDYEWSRVQAAALAADTVLFVGTSFSVGVTDLVVQYAGARQAAIYSIDPAAGPSFYPEVRLLALPAEELLPAVCRELEAEPST